MIGIGLQPACSGVVDGSTTLLLQLPARRDDDDLSYSGDNNNDDADVCELNDAVVGVTESA